MCLNMVDQWYKLLDRIVLGSVFEYICFLIYLINGFGWLLKPVVKSRSRFNIWSDCCNLK